MVATQVCLHSTTTHSDKKIQEVTIILLDKKGKELYQMPGIREAVKTGETINLTVILLQILQMHMILKL